MKNTLENTEGAIQRHGQHWIQDTRRRMKMNLLNDLLSKYNDIKININRDTSVTIEIELTSRSSLRDIRVTL